MLELTFLSGNQRGRSSRLTFQRAWFGRQPTCDFVIEGEQVSRIHFVIQKRGDDYVLIDNKSTNGTFVDGQRTAAATIRPGQRIMAGGNVIEVREAVGEAVGFRFVAEWKGAEGDVQIIERAAITLGRKNICHIQLNEPAISPVHAEIRGGPDGVWITDQSSGAGVYIDGRRVVKQQLRQGNVVTIGLFEITIGLAEGICFLGIRLRSKDSQVLPENLPELYREVVAASQPSGASEAKPSASIAAQPNWIQDSAPIWVPTTDILPNRFRARMVLVTVVAVVAWGAYALAVGRHSVYIPGPTAKVHSTANARFSKRLDQYELPSECGACHSAFAGVQSANCQICHAAIRAAGIHERRGLACASCHSEHKGGQFDIARNVGAGCQAAGCHTSVHETQKFILVKQAPLAKQDLPEGVTTVPTVAFEAPFRKSGDGIHIQHADLKGDCGSCHIDGENPKIKTPRATMRGRCLACHGFGPEATLRQRCYSCHFEHPTKAPEKVLAALRFPDSPTPAKALLTGSNLSGVLLFMGVLAGVPLLYFMMMAARFRLDHGKARTAARLRVPVMIGPGEQQAPAPVAPKPTDNQTPGGNLRPQISLDLCVGCGACVQVCPFNVLEVVNEKAIAARLDDCTGYAACIAECPTDAIKLVSGGAMQTVELPVYDECLETNVSGLYLAGEVTGKALIKVAINQGKQVVDAILKNRPQPGEPYDVIVVGAGPAGTSAALSALKEGLSVLVLEQGTTANTIRNYPRQKFVMAEPVMIPVYGPLWMEDSSKEDLVERWQQMITSTGLVIHENEKVLRLVQGSGHFLVQSSKGEYGGARVVLAIGRRGSPRKLGVPGEDSAKVAYNLLDADAYAGKAICVVGGGDAGIETANGLARADLGNRVWLVHRGEDFSKAKPRNEKKIKKSMETGRVKVFFNAGVVEIRKRSVSVQSPAGTEEIDNDFVFVQVGGESPKKFLSECGIEFSQRALG